MKEKTCSMLIHNKNQVFSLQPRKRLDSFTYTVRNYIYQPFQTHSLPVKSLPQKSWEKVLHKTDEWGNHGYKSDSGWHLFTIPHDSSNNPTANYEYSQNHFESDDILAILKSSRVLIIMYPDNIKLSMVMF